MTLRSPAAAFDRNAVSPKLLTSPTSRDLGAEDDMPAARSPKLLRTNSSKKVSAASSLERAMLSFKTWESDAAARAPADHVPPPPSPVVVRRIHGARPGRLALDLQGTLAGSRQPSPLHDAAATTVQKMFKGHRTRRSLADCAIVVEELWWKLYDQASLDRKSISFFTGGGKQETAASRWVRAGKRIAKVGKGLCKDDKAQQLALRHWLEAIDPRHRYGHNLHLYYDIWFQSSSTEPFFYWLDIGAGREIHHPSCPRSKLNSQLVMYMGMNERAAYEVVVEDGRLTYLQSGLLVNTTDESKWIFVLSTSRSLYVGQKRKGQFQHSSFLAGGATSAAGRLVAKDGVLKAIWPYSGHYLPTEENFNEFISFLQEHNVDLTNVKRCSVDDDEYPSLKRKQTSDVVEPSSQEEEEPKETAGPTATAMTEEGTTAEAPLEAGDAVVSSETSSSRALVKWTSGAGARIGCVRDYPAELQSRALEQVNLSPNGPSSSAPLPPWLIPSPRPSPRIRLSPRVQYMANMASPSVRPLKQQCLGIRTHTVRLTLPSNKNGKAGNSSVNPSLN
ncbi:IQ domain-containing protein IQM1 [Dichanthelium oligosanthes]|uniref:IQ domain-containing protein IQM1 n=1 Tax=Dichanthelium oligosanthes TaxID=888268 RepID=A0A1E5VSD2_9POAL|nr:IQ domain-containing protein IQM1 [Dichanthelium oligosanthes]